MVLTLEGVTITETQVFLLLHQSLPHRLGDHSLVACLLVAILHYEETTVAVVRLWFLNQGISR